MTPNGSEQRERLSDQGEADVQIIVDRETYRNLQEAYLRAADAGYSEDFDTYAYNHCATTARVVVDDEGDGERSR